MAALSAPPARDPPGAGETLAPFTITPNQWLDGESSSPYRGGANRFNRKQL